MFSELETRRGTSVIGPSTTSTVRISSYQKLSYPNPGTRSAAASSKMTDRTIRSLRRRASMSRGGVYNRADQPRHGFDTKTYVFSRDRYRPQGLVLSAVSPEI